MKSGEDVGRADKMALLMWITAWLAPQHLTASDDSPWAPCGSWGPWGSWVLLFTIWHYKTVFNNHLTVFIYLSVRTWHHKSPFLAEREEPSTVKMKPPTVRLRNDISCTNCATVTENLDMRSFHGGGKSTMVPPAWEASGTPPSWIGL